MIGYPEIILTQVKFAEQYGNLEVAMADAIEYMRRNLKAKKAFLKTIQYPIVADKYISNHANRVKYDCDTSISTIIRDYECSTIYFTKYTYRFHYKVACFCIIAYILFNCDIYNYL